LDYKKKTTEKNKPVRDAYFTKHGKDHGFHQSDDYVMRHYPGKNDDDYAKAKAANKGSGHVLKKYGRLGKDNPNAEKYKGKSYQYIKAKDAAHFDVYKRKVHKEETEVNELSKKTLGNYIKANHFDTSVTATRVGEAKPSKSGALYKRLGKRSRGMAAAVDKLTREEVNEVSKNKLRRYIDSAAGDLADRRHRSGMMSKDFINPDVLKNWFKGSNRLRGIRKASEKLSGHYGVKVTAKEAVEVKDVEVIKGAKREGRARKRFLSLSGAKDNVDDKNKVTETTRKKTVAEALANAYRSGVLKKAVKTKEDDSATHYNTETKDGRSLKMTVPKKDK